MKAFILAIAFATVGTAAMAQTNNPSMGDNSNKASNTLGAETTGGQNGDLHMTTPAEKTGQAGDSSMAMNSHHHHHHHTASSASGSSYDSNSGSH